MVYENGKWLMDDKDLEMEDKAYEKAAKALKPIVVCIGCMAFTPLKAVNGWLSVGLPIYLRIVSVMRKKYLKATILSI